jgi:3-oxoacyl-[acyl-carrier-protein] synthase-3
LERDMSYLRPVYITGTGAFLPGERIGNADMEAFLGAVGGRPSPLGRRALRWNGIAGRHYALEPDGRWLHSNASMCADAVRLALGSAGLGREDLDCLTAATTQGDLLAPGHASAVHGELGGGGLEVASFQSVCASALMAAKYAWMAVGAGDADCAATTAGEFSSRWFRPEFLRGRRAGRRQGPAVHGGRLPAVHPVGRGGCGGDGGPAEARRA